MLWWVVDASFEQVGNLGFSMVARKCKCSWNIFDKLDKDVRVVLWRGISTCLCGLPQTPAKYCRTPLRKHISDMIQVILPTPLENLIQGKEEIAAIDHGYMKIINVPLKTLHSMTNLTRARQHVP